MCFVHVCVCVRGVGACMCVCGGCVRVKLSTTIRFTLVQDITAIMTEKDCQIRSLEEKINELKV